MTSETIYDCCVVGGGLAGLSLASLLAKNGCSVLVCEQKSYPMHKVCGEYVSMESFDFLIRLGLPLEKMDLPLIDKLNVSAPDGTVLSQSLDPGGFGISRFKLDHELAKLAVKNSVVLLENTKVQDVRFENEQFRIKTNDRIYFSKVCIGSFGKTGSVLKNETGASNSGFVGIKYHIKTDLIQSNLIELHNFKDGYCGISMIEDGKACLCYLTTAANLKMYKNNISELEANVLMKNIHLKKIFENSEFLYDKPLTISNVTFHSKQAVSGQMLMIGDAAGSIAPLCGNGMSMAFRGAHLASGIITQYLKDEISREHMNQTYDEKWKQNFSKRITAGAGIQKLFGGEVLTNLSIRTLKYFPAVTRKLINLTHGTSF